MSKKLIGFIVAVVALTSLLVYSQRPQGPLKVSGLIESDKTRVGSRVGGRVARVFVEEGDAVKQGDVLVELEPYDLLERRMEAYKQVEARHAEYEKLSAGYRPEEIAQAKARLEQLQARLSKLESGPRKQEIAAAQAQVNLAKAERELASSKLERLRKLGGAASREEMDRVEAELKTTRDRVAVREAELALLEEGTRKEDIEEARAQVEEAAQAYKMREQGYRKEEVAQARASMDAAKATLNAIDKQIEELKVRAPFDAVVEAVELRPGDLVNANAQIVSLLDRRKMWVRAYVPENRLDLKLDQKLKVSVDSFPNEKFEGTVIFIARQAEFTPSNVQTPEERSKQVFRIKVQLEQGLDRLRPGMNADVWLEPVK